MKKVTLRAKQWHRIHVYCSLKRTRRRKRGFKPSLAPGTTYLCAPSEMCLTNNFIGVISLIDKLQIYFLKKNVYVDFRPITKVSPDALLLLAATLDMWQRLKSIRLRVRHIKGWDPEIVDLFDNLGLFRLLKTPGRSKDQSPNRQPGIKILQLCSGEGADGSLANELTQSLKDMAGDLEAQREIFVGLTEAMANVTHHAYPNHLYANADGEFKRWWMTGSYDADNRSLRVLILDLGVGIPNTLPRSPGWEWCKSYIERITGNPNDADWIEAALSVGRTATKMSGRGHGLEDIRKFVEESTAGRLRILSGRGEVVYVKGHAHPQKISHPISIPGTLIEWEVFR